jgi:hypothetical protein
MGTEIALQIKSLRIDDNVCCQGMGTEIALQILEVSKTTDRMDPQKLGVQLTLWWWWRSHSHPYSGIHIV